ncbi:MAG TPA: hypothetical protein VLJ76_11465 [Gaiellaceae bacterium]|nr:hypothetical protein [Gaiellaceae bacterium]
MRRLAPLVLVTGLVVAGLTAARAGARTAVGKAPAVGARTQDDEMTYHNGDVILHNTIYVVWWDAGVGFASGANDQSAYEDRVAHFLSNLEGTTYYHILSQYYMTNSNGDKEQIGPYTKFGGSWTDFTPPTANPVDTSDIANEVDKARNTNNWPSGLSTIVVVFLPTGYNVCVTGVGCSPNDFCAFHLYSQTQDSNDGPIIKTPYVALPAPSQNLATCGAQYFWPADPDHLFPDDLFVQSGPAKSGDASINDMSHELFEAITDPFPDQTDSNRHPQAGWWNDVQGNTLGEIGDKCAYVFDPFWVQAGNGVPPPSNKQDQDGTYTLGGENFVVQEEWSNSDERCLYDTLAPPADPETPTGTATNEDGTSYTFGTWTNQSVNVTIHAADAPAGLGLDKIETSFDENSDTSVPFTVDDDGFHVTSDAIPWGIPGQHTLDVKADSYSGRSTTARIGAIWEDFAPPDVSLSAPTPDGDNGYYVSPSDLPVHVTASASDGLSGVESTTCTLDGSGVDADSIDVTGDGQHTVSCYSTDNAGNTSTTATQTIKIDTSSPPTVTVTPPTPVHGHNGWFDADDTQPIDVTVSASKDSGGSDIASINCVLDNAGNVTLTDTSGIGSSTNASGTAPLSGDSSHSLRCAATDEAGHESSPVEKLVEIDTVKPTLTGTPTTSPNSNGWYKGNVTIQWTCSDGNSGVAGSCPANDTISQEGTNLAVQQSISDVAGNTTTSTSTAVNVDKTAPVVTVVTPSIVHGANGWFDAQDTLPVQVGVTADDSVGGASGVSTIDCTLDGSPAAIVSGKVAVSGDGIHHVSCISTDRAGNTSATGTAGSTATIKIDATAPSFSASLSPTNPAATGWYNTATGAPTASYTCSDATSGLAVACPSPYTFPQGGNQTYSQTITDQAGNSRTVVVGPLSVDLTFPACTATPTPAKLPPQNKSLYPVSVALGLNYDAISGAGTTVLQSLTTNEGDISKESSGWVLGTQSTSGKLLATHNPNDGKGRVYTLTYDITNKAGNAKTCVTTVTVPDVPVLFEAPNW